MKEEHALLAGELSGHIMFGNDYYGYDDALYGACLLIDIVARRQGTLAELDRHLPEVRLDPRAALPGHGRDQVPHRRAAPWSTSARGTRWWTWTARACSSATAGG